uniref:Uncharacterized protein n=1 Tax=Cacopsylla melanoneura TaxID=428564 RepID=A0A8D8W4D6_9HEMI
MMKTRNQARKKWQQYRNYEYKSIVNKLSRIIQYDHTTHDQSTRNPKPNPKSAPKKLVFLDSTINVQDKYTVPFDNAFESLSPKDTDDKKSVDEDIITSKDSKVKIPPIILPTNGEKIETISNRIKILIQPFHPQIHGG